MRIAIGGRYLDEVQIRENLPGTCYLSFPAHRRRARVRVMPAAGDR